MIPTDKAYLVEFQDKQGSNDPALCWKTCEEVYPQTSLGNENTMFDSIQRYFLSFFFQVIPKPYFHLSCNFSHGVLGR